MKEKKIELCCGGRGCPTIEEKNKDTIIITDDDGNKIELTKEQALMIPSAIDKL
mgnify:CR=1 FL=1